MTLSEFVFKVIENFGAKHTFGIPGDFALPLYATQEQTNVEGIICTHEPNAVFAADAYARVSGLGVVLTTYGAGALNMINPVAMAYAEKSPIVVISGAPEQQMKQENRYIHHLVRDYQTQIKIFQEICVESVSIQSLETACQEILKAFNAAILEQQPAYIEIPRNLMSEPLPNPVDLTASDLSQSLSDHESLEEAFREINQMVCTRKNPIIHAGIGVRRYRLKEQLELWSEKLSIPVVTSVLAKGAFSEEHPNFRGMYMGDMGNSETRDLLANSDCVIQIGLIESDVNTGFWTGVAEKGKSIVIDPHKLRVSHHHYNHVYINDLITKLANTCETKLPIEESEPKNITKETTVTDSTEMTPITVAETLNDLDLNQYHVLCDIGDSWFIGLELKANSFMAPGYYASMGFAVPGAVGSGLGQPGKRNLVLVGDGAFQMTGNEIATLQNLKIPTTVVLINNKSYKMLESFDQYRSYYDLNNWNYVQFSNALHCNGVQVDSTIRLKEELKKAEETPGVTLIEVVIDKNNHPPIMKKIREFMSQ